MSEHNNCRLFLILIFFCSESTATINLQEGQQTYPTHSKNKILARKKYSSPERHDLKITSAWEDHNQSPHISQTDRKWLPPSLAKANAKIPRNVFVASAERSLRMPREIGTSSAEPERTEEKVNPEPGSDWPEPGPDWPSAFEAWGKAWDLHVYAFALLYVIIVATSGIAIASDILTNRGIKGLKLTLHLTLVFFGCCRAIILFVDPYSSRGVLGMFGTYITWSLGFPCVLTALGLLLLVFVDVTKMNLAPPRFQKLSTALGVMVINVFMVLITDLVFLLTQNGFFLVIICEVYFFLLGVILTAGFFLVGLQISDNSVEDIYGDTGLSRLRMLAFVTAALNLLFLGVQVYAMFEFENGGIPRPWSWYAVQTSLRALEISMCAVMFFIVFNNRMSSSVACWRRFFPSRFCNTVTPFQPTTTMR